MAMILSDGVDACTSKLADLVVDKVWDKVSMMLGVKGELNKLLRKLEMIRNVLEDAERKGPRDASIRLWVCELTDIMYDADDIIDLCWAKSAQLLEDHQAPSPTPSVRSQFSMISYFREVKYRYDIADQLKQLNNRLKEITDDSSVLSRLDSIQPATFRRCTTVDHRQTTSSMVESEVVGDSIQNLTEDLVESLIKENQRRKCCMFGIVGMGGIGKTTLARMVYNHPTIANHFTVKIWLCVSQTYSETDLLKQIIRGAGGVCGEASSRAELENILSSTLSNKLFFLVLDDVWRANVWEDLLRIPLESCGATVGRVLVTTRNEAVARNMSATVHNVQKMNVSDGLTLLRNKVFKDFGMDERMMIGLEDIGIKIVGKCDGLPLAIKVIAGVLRSKEISRREWEKVLGSGAWSITHLPEELQGALYLSFEDLPSELKQCFLYFSLFPEDTYIFKENLVGLWVSEGLIKSDKGAASTMEDVGEDYFHELIGRNLLQADPKYIDPDTCMMHDLLRSLAQYLSKDENICIDKGDGAKIRTTKLTKIRRMSFVDTAEITPNVIMEHSHLRTLIFFDTPPSHLQTLLQNGHLFDALGRLRVLDLSNTGIERLPDSVGKLIHLRYLNLKRTNIMQLPESVGNLVNLLSLRLESCKCFHTLPNSITRLCNLRVLDIWDTQVSHMPVSFGRLKQLSRLVPFVVGDPEVQEACRLEELQSLEQLRTLTIQHLERVASSGPSIRSTLTKMPFLKILVLVFYPPPEPIDIDGGNTTDETSLINQVRAEKVLEDLSPPPSLQGLQIVGFPGRGYPSWLSLSTSFPSLETLNILNCKSVTKLTSLGQLPQLRHLLVEGADSIVTVGPELLFDSCHASNPMVPFPRLEYLMFERMSNWEEWSFDDRTALSESRIFPLLNQLRILDCPKLKSLPMGLRHATSLKKLNIEYAHSIKVVHPVDILILRNCENLQRISDFGTLRRLTVVNCPRLVHVANPNLLKVVYTEECLTEWVRELATLQQLQQGETSTSRALPPGLDFCLICSPDQLRRCLTGGEDWPIIQQFPRVTVVTYDESESLLYIKTPYTYTVKLSTETDLNPDGQP